MPADRFEYLFLHIGTSADGSHPPLPHFGLAFYTDLINSATGDSLPAPYGDWKWIPTQQFSQQFQNTAPGEYIFALRATDEAGALEQGLEDPCNIRWFTVTSRITGPLLSVCTSLAPNCSFSQTATDIGRAALETLEGSSVSFSWSASADSYGGSIVGYSYALDDTSGLSSFDRARIGVTFSPGQLLPGMHFVFVRALDDGGAVTNVVIPLLVIEPAFRDPAHGRQVLYVDDSIIPGVWSPVQDATTSVGNFPNDVVETEWYTTQLFTQLGVPVTEWDALNAGFAELQTRKPPPLRILANYSTVVWNVDFNNSVTYPTALWRTLHGDHEWALRNYLRAGGTLIVTGFDVSSNTVNPLSLFQGTLSSLCSTFGSGDLWSYFPALFMGVDDAELNIARFRSQGARDFIAAAATAAGGAMGFDSTRLDRGPTGSGAKWITDIAGGNGESSYQPGLGRVDGWILASEFGCLPSGTLRSEDPGAPIAEAILSYHGVNMGLAEDGGPSPREGLVVGIRVQAHSEGPATGGVITRGSAQGVLGRMVHFSFPFFWLRDEDAIQAMQAAFQYVNASPTLP